MSPAMPVSTPPDPVAPFRPYAGADAAAIAAIYAHYVRNSVVTFDLEPPSVEQIAARFATIADLGHPLFVAEAGGEVIGFAYASTYRTRPAYRFTCEDSLYLHPDHAGRGLGSAMLERLIVDARAFGFHQMIAIITAGTGPSIALHRKFGFDLLATFPELGRKFDRWLDVVHMQKALGED
jgi:L-amino acid N-acyltransferase YncA